MNETRVVDLRTRRGWTQERLAGASGITIRTVQRLEAGNDASLDTLTRVAKALEVQVRDLFTTVDESDHGRAVTALDARAARQQERRDTITDGLEALYYGIGALFTIAVIVGVASRRVASRRVASRRTSSPTSRSSSSPPTGSPDGCSRCSSSSSSSAPAWTAGTRCRATGSSRNPTFGPEPGRTANPAEADPEIDERTRPDGDRPHRVSGR